MLYDRKSGLEEWSFTFRRALFEWEVEEGLRLKALLLSAPTLKRDVPDCPRWNATCSGWFSVSSTFSCVFSNASHHFKLPKLIWINYLPPKVQFFGWLAWKHRVKTTMFLKNIGALPGNVDSRCIFCKTDEESSEHALLFCSEIWK